MTKPEVQNQTGNAAVTIVTESDFINQAISGSPRTSRKFNNKFSEVPSIIYCILIAPLIHLILLVHGWLELCHLLGYFMLWLKRCTYDGPYCRLGYGFTSIGAPRQGL